MKTWQIWTNTKYNKFNEHNITSIFGVNEELVEFVGHAMRQSFAIDFHSAGVANFRLTDIDLERRVGYVLTMSVHVHQVVTDFTGSERNSCKICTYLFVDFYEQRRK